MKRIQIKKESINESSIKSKNFVEFKAFGNLKPQFTVVNEDFKFSSNAEISEIGLFRPGSLIDKCLEYQYLMSKILLIANNE